MPRQRFIQPSIWSDPDFGKLSDSERVLFIGMFSNADDEGRILASPSYLRSLVWPYDDRLTGTRVRSLRDGVVAKFRTVALYEVAGIEYITFLNWREYQKPKYPKPSKLPPPPATDNGARSPTSSESLPQDFGSASEDVPPQIGFGLDRDKTKAVSTGKDPAREAGESNGPDFQIPETLVRTIE
jgi:hypothetical protein